MRTTPPAPLNEGRSRNPGDTRIEPGGVAFAIRRSTKAGVETPATLLDPMLSIKSAHARSTKAGVETPATLASTRPRARNPCSLNEGRSRNPGDTLSRAQKAIPGEKRSTKAGVETPATPCLFPLASLSPLALNEGRSRNPGDTRRLIARVFKRLWNAQRRPESKPRRHTRRSTCTAASTTISLNEGRSRNPGDTIRLMSFIASVSTLNEGRSRNPGDTMRRRRYRQSFRTLNEGRSRNPGDTSTV